MNHPLSQAPLDGRSMTPTLSPTELQLTRAIEHADQVRHTLSPGAPEQWQRYVDALRGVSLANWSATTDLQTKFLLARAVLNEIR
jgi:phytoene dehydrogenase-like protein